ncbi:MAG: tetratricopeptide repeat protein [Chloroflexota bacterium]
MALSSIHQRAQLPYVSGIVQRPRLMRKVQLAIEHKLTLICAPPGYGKSTLTAQFVQSQSHPFAWHAIEERQRDISNLQAQIVSSLKYLVPDIQSLANIPGYSARELAAALANHIRETVEGQIVFVMDDVHLLTGSPAAETWLRSFVSLLPVNCHLILLSRVLPDLPLTEMIARREVLAIGQDQLRFTTDEIFSLAETLKIFIPQPQAQELSLRLEGWPAGTVLALQPLPPDLERSMLNGGEGPEALFDALAQVMLDAQPPGLRNFLLASSTLTRITPELCANVLELPDSAEWLAEALRGNLFLSRVSGGLEYHRLFRVFLQRQLEKLDPDLYTKLHARAARWYEENDRLDDAFDHYLSGGIIQAAAGLADRAAQAYFAQGKVETLLIWEAQLHHELVNIPRLLLACAKVHTDRYDYQHAEADLNAAESSFVMSSDPVMFADIQLQRARCSLQRGDYHQAAKQATQVLQTDHLETRLQGRALRTLGFAYLRLGDYQQAVEHLEAALPLYRADGDAYALSQLLQDLVATYSQLKHHHRLSAFLQEAVALRRSLGSPSPLAFALNNLGYFYHRCGDYQQALFTLEEGISVVTRISDKRAEGYLLWSLGDLKRDLGAFNEALRMYHKALELTGTSEPALRCSILINSSTLKRWQGKIQEAIALAEEARSLAQQHSLAVEENLADAAFWVGQAQQTDPQSALLHIETIATKLRENNADFELLRILGLAAYVALLSDNVSAAHTHFEAAINLAETVGSNLPIVTEVLHTSLLEDFVTANLDIHGHFKQDLKTLNDSQLNISPTLYTSEPTILQTPYSLRIFSLGQDVLEKDGQRVGATEWRSTGAKELFLYLLFQGPASREDVSLAFWPESSTKRVRSNFHTTLYRARHALGEPVIGFENGLYFINPECDVWCDAREFDVLTQQARLLSPRDARAEDLWRKAAKHYRGEFLPSLDADWITPWRERFHEAYIETLIGLGNCARARGDMRGAIDSFRHALQVDPYREDIYRGIMNCYANLGEKRQIVFYLRQLQDILQRDLDVDPSPETLALAEALLA